MSTRAQIIVSKSGLEDAYVYHHCDGYPSGVGADLEGFIKLPQAKCKTPKDFSEALIDYDSSFQLNDRIPNDVEYIYFINLGGSITCLECWGSDYNKNKDDLKWVDSVRLYTKYFSFEPNRVRDEIIEWIRDWFDKNGKGCNAILGLSGGKDSTIIAALCAKALGPERVYGVAMPDHEQGINDADKIAEYLGINFIKAPIDGITSGFGQLWHDFKWSRQSEQNIPPRIRMTMLYALAQTCNGRVACCDNLSEIFIGYSTLFGDNVGSFAPLAGLTVTEVREIGDALGIPKEWVYKTPDDGLPNSCPDEEKFKFSYEELDEYIRTGDTSDSVSKALIETMHANSEFKRQLVNIPKFELWWQV